MSCGLQQFRQGNYWEFGFFSFLAGIFDIFLHLYKTNNCAMINMKLIHSKFHIGKCNLPFQCKRWMVHAFGLDDEVVNDCTHYEGHGDDEEHQNIKYG